MGATFSMTFLFPLAATLEPSPGNTDGVTVYNGYAVGAALPMGLPNDINARKPNTRNAVARAIRESALTEPKYFHLLNSGITLVCDSIEQVEGTHYKVTFGKVGGILNGGHTYAVLSELAQAGRLEAGLSVPVSLKVGVPEELILRMSATLNSSTAVSMASLENRKGSYDSLKRSLGKFTDRISWFQNDPGECKVEYILQNLAVFDVKTFSADDHPHTIFQRKAKTVTAYAEAPGQFDYFAPLHTEILLLADLLRNKVGEEVFRLTGEAMKSEKGKPTDLIKTTRKQLVFAEQKCGHALPDAALFPLLAAFRSQLVIEAGKVSWSGGYKKLQKTVEANATLLADELLKTRKRADGESLASQFRKDDTYRHFYNFMLGRVFN